MCDKVYEDFVKELTNNFASICTVLPRHLNNDNLFIFIHEHPRDWDVL